MLEDIKKDASERMQKSIDSLLNELQRVRTGRAHPSLLEHIQVDYYGSSTPLKQVANVSIEDARTLSVVPWEKTMVQPIEKAIMESDLGLNPMSAGEVIRIPLPPLTEERRKEMVKLVKQTGEFSKVAVRNIRRDANSDFKDLLKDKEITEDDLHRAEEDVQKITDKFVADIDAALVVKEAELMEV